MAMALRRRGCARLCHRSVLRALHLGPLEQPDSPQPQPHTDSKFTNFGFREVPEQEKSKLVGEVFSSVATNYDLMNDLMSGGLHRLWKDRLVSKLAPFPGMQHLDVAGGTGDVAFRVVDAIRKAEQRVRGSTLADADEEDRTRVYVCDINPNMLEVGKKRAKERGLGNAACLVWMEGDAEALTLKDESVDGYSIAFGIRNVTHIDRALKEAYRVLRRGGRFLCLELSHVSTPGFKEMYDAYSFNVIPRMGEVVSGDRASYQYLVESVRKFPNQEKFGSMIADAGFKEVEYENLVRLHLLEPGEFGPKLFKKVASWFRSAVLAPAISPVAHEEEMLESSRAASNLDVGFIHITFHARQSVLASCNRLHHLFACHVTHMTPPPFLLSSTSCKRLESLVQAHFEVTMHRHPAYSVRVCRPSSTCTLTEMWIPLRMCCQAKSTSCCNNSNESQASFACDLVDAGATHLTFYTLLKSFSETLSCSPTSYNR